MLRIGKDVVGRGHTFDQPGTNKQDNFQGIGARIAIFKVH
jgi:hypothetical protein